MTSDAVIGGALVELKDYHRKLTDAIDTLDTLFDVPQMETAVQPPTSNLVQMEKRRRMSPAARRRISVATRRRWAAVRKAGKTSLAA